MNISPEFRRRVALRTGALLVGASVSAAHAGTINVIDIIPASQSSETGRNAEPSIAVNPLNPLQMVAGAFSSTAAGRDTVSPMWLSTNGGTTWSSYGSFASVDKSLTWRQDGVGPIATALHCISCTDTTFSTQVFTYNGGANSFGNPVNATGATNIDQPWVRSGPGGQTYVTYNDLGPSSGKSASIMVSSNNGSTYAAPVALETVAPAAGQDAPSVRSAVNGSTVYAAFTRWGAPIEGEANGDTRFGGTQIVVVKSTDAGAHFNSGVTAADATGFIAQGQDTPLTFGHTRSGSDIAIAVDPNNPNRVVVAYSDAPGPNESGVVQLHIVESKDGGATWTNKFTTSADVRAGWPALSILENGGVGLLYLAFDPLTGKQSQHFLATTNDFAKVDDTLLGIQENLTFFLGDFYDLTSVGNSFYGVFTAWNNDNGTEAFFPSVTYQRSFSGTEGASSFNLGVGSSVDPFFFTTTLTSMSAVPEPSTWAMMLLGFGGLGLAGLRARSKAVGAV